MTGTTVFLISLLSGMLLSGIVQGNEEDREHWDKRYDTPEYIYGKEPVEFLEDHIDLLLRGKALVLAMGEGRNAVFLAQRGFQVEGCDISPIAVRKALHLAQEKGTEIKAFEADLDFYKIAPEKYDLIACFYYLQRDLIPQIKEGLKPGGMVIMETYTIDNQRLGFSGPKNPDYLLKPNELLHLFSDMKVILYREVVVDGKKAVASIIAQRVE